MMCGIVAGLSQQNVVPILLEGLKRLEYRGYDSCGVAVVGPKEQLAQLPGLQRARSTARVAQLESQVSLALESGCGIAHTRWATHGAPKEHNAHPHFSDFPTQKSAYSHVKIGLVHNGIIENFALLKAKLSAQGYNFVSQTDTEVVVHLIHSNYRGDLSDALKKSLKELKGAYALAVICDAEPQRLVGARVGSPLVLGCDSAAANAHSTQAGYFLASDAMALAGVTQSFVFLEEGDCVDLRVDGYRIENASGQVVQRELRELAAYSEGAQLGPYQHYMQKEIFEQPQAIADTLEGVISIGPELFELNGKSSAKEVFERTEHILILACGTSYYSASTAKYWLEGLAKIPTQVEIASEYRYRESIQEPGTLVVSITQSGETADTLAAVRHAVSLGLKDTLTICNVATSAMVRESSLAYITRAGVEVGVASTKAFTTQLVALFLLTLVLAKQRGHLSSGQETKRLEELRHLPLALQSVLALEPQVIAWAHEFTPKEHALFLGRGLHYPIALEGALKLKEISYIHAEAYPAGELKHGPLALVTNAMPVVTVAPNDALLEKLKSNMQEVRARGGVLFCLSDADSHIESEEGLHVIRMPEHFGALSPILHVVPLQLLAYHTALARGSDVDKPRNLAKSVTVE